MRERAKHPFHLETYCKGQRMDSVKDTPSPTKKEELYGFLFLTIFLAPAMAVALVATYGFSIWIYQLIVGPPGVS